jgi:glycolate oxidase FAD binding subunit
MSVLDEFRDRILSAAAAKKPVRIRGGGTKDFYGEQLRGDLLDTTQYAGMVAYEPTELVFTARTGTRLSDIKGIVAEQGQMLAFEPPSFGEGATIGGVIASGLSGPRRASSGAVRDFVLGATMMDGQGEILRFGGTVMKNVAGYDVSRLMAGSMGTLGLLLEVSVKVLPVPVAQRTIRFDVDEITALRKLNEWGGQALPISASCWHNGQLTVRLSGAQAAVDAALRSLGGEQIVGSIEFWTTLREQHHAFFAGEEGLWRLSLPSAASALVLGGPQLIEWGGAQRWLRAPASAASSIRQNAAAAGGHATFFRGKKDIKAFHPLSPALARINQHVRNGLDPSGVFNTGRLG